MLGDTSDADRIYIACGYTDMRKAINGLAALVEQNFKLSPYENSLFLFCGRRRDRIKALYWEGDGFLLLYKRLPLLQIFHPFYHLSYYLGSPIIPNWVKWNYYLIPRDEFNGKTVIKGGKACVLLDKTILKNTMDEKAGIMTWVDIDNLEMVSAGVEVQPEMEFGNKYYRLQVGAFSEKRNAEALMAQLKKAGFDAYMKYE